MTFSIELNLQYRAAISIAVSLWEKNDVKQRVKEYIPMCSRSAHYDMCSGSRHYNMCTGSTYYRESNTTYWDLHNDLEWRKLIKEVTEQLSYFALPSKLKNLLIHLVKEIGNRICNWFSYIVSESEIKYKNLEQAMDYFEEIYWTPYGTVDTVKIIKRWLHNPCLSPAIVYKFACNYALKEYIDDLGNQVQQEIGNHVQREIELGGRYFGNIYYHILAYWPFSKNDNTSQLLSLFMQINHPVRNEVYVHRYSINENLFRLLVYTGDCKGALYFWDRLKEEERKRNLLDCARLSIKQYETCDRKFKTTSRAVCEMENFVELFVFFINQMDIVNRKALYNDKLRHTLSGLYSEEKDAKSIIFKMLLSIWPWQELLIPLFGDMLPYVNDEIIHVFLNAITEKLREDYRNGYAVANSTYRCIFKEVWCMIPRTLKQKSMQMNNCLEFVDDLFSMWDLASLKLVIGDPELAHLRDNFLECRRDKYRFLIIFDDYALLDQFVESIFISKNEKENFKQSQFFIDFLTDFIKENDVERAEKLLDWLSDKKSHDKNEFKKKIDYISICEYFITSKQHYFIDKFLNWLFESTEERKKCIGHFKDEKFSTCFVYEVWSCFSYDVDTAVELSSNFLKWFFNSEDERAYFKKEKLVSSNFCKYLDVGFVQKGLTHKIEDFLLWCLFPSDKNDNRHLMKKVLGYEMETCQSKLQKRQRKNSNTIEDLSVHFTSGLKVEEFIEWTLSLKKEMMSLVERYIASNSGLNLEKLDAFFKSYLEHLKNVNKYSLQRSFPEFYSRDKAKRQKIN